MEQSHFIRNYEAMVKRLAEDAKMPASVLELIRNADPQLTATPAALLEA